MPDDDHKLSDEAKVIMRFATIAGLRDDCEQLAALFAELTEAQRAKLMVLLFGEL